MDGVLAVACGAAAVSGASIAVTWHRSREEAGRQRTLRAAMDSGGGASMRFESGGMPARILSMVCKEAPMGRSARLRRVARSPALGLGLAEAPSLLERSGLAGIATGETLRIVRLKAFTAAGLAGALGGLAFSGEMSCLLALAGAFCGYACVPWALKQEAKARNAEMERHLSEMLEVVVLGLRSGLSFERAFGLYPRYFESGLGRAMDRTMGQWDMGLMTREEALRRLEAEYDSRLLSRVVGSMVRSLRFGTSVVDSLEASAVEAREAHKAVMEERVAKVAVKMMLPVGALILPAMLLLVLGPVLLELVEGF